MVEPTSMIQTPRVVMLHLSHLSEAEADSLSVLAEQGLLDNVYDGLSGIFLEVSVRQDPLCPTRLSGLLETLEDTLVLAPYDLVFFHHQGPRLDLLPSFDW